MSERLEALLIGERVLPAAIVREAVARQRVYGGGLDTALLEMGVLSEAALWARLATATGLPVPAPALADGTNLSELSSEGTGSLSQAQTALLRAVPVAQQDRTLKLLCAEPVAADDIRLAASRAGYDAKLYVVPEVRLLALRQRVYGETLPPRFAPILARGMGAERARKAFTPLKVARAPVGPSVVFPRAPAAPVASSSSDSGAALTPLEQVMEFSQPLLVDSELEQAIELHEEDLQVFAEDRERIRRTDDNDQYAEYADDGVPLAHASAASSGEGPADSATEALCRRARDREDKGRVLALRALRRRRDHALTRAFVDQLRQSAADETDDRAATTALEGLSELRDEAAIPIFIYRLDSSVADVRIAAGQALVMLTARDFADASTWREWWRENARRPRTDWLLEALAHPDAATRQLSFDEMRALSSETFGYAPNLQKRKREAARRRWAAWWGRQRSTTPPVPLPPLQPDA